MIRALLLLVVAALILIQVDLDGVPLIAGHLGLLVAIAIIMLLFLTDVVREEN